MASIVEPSHQPGHRWIQLRVGTSRRTVRLGKVSRRNADKVLVKVEALATAIELGLEPDVDVAAWLARCGEFLHGRLAAAGLTQGRPRVDITLGETVDAFVRDYSNENDGSKKAVQVALARLVGHFGAEKTIRSIDVDAAQRCREALAAEGYAEASIATTIKKARQLWKAAAKEGIVNGVNPWAEVVAGDFANDTRAHYVDRGLVKKILAACSNEWCLIVALSRFAGLRFPSEHLRLTHGDFGADRFTVHGKGKRKRSVPIFEDLAPFLPKLGKPSKPLISEDLREVTASALRKQFATILKNAGISAWPRLFHNLRASCETDLARQGFKPHVYTAWLGHTEPIAKKHYLQVTEEDFEAATGGKKVIKIG